MARPGQQRLREQSPQEPWLQLFLKEIPEAHFCLPSDDGERMARLPEGFQQAAAQSFDPPNNRASILIGTTAYCPSVLDNWMLAGLAPTLQASASRPV